MIRVAIVDDHEMVREGLKVLLASEADIEVVGEASSGEHLGELASAAQPDVVLLDARMPGVGGAEACRRLATSHPKIAVLMVSSYSDDELVQQCIRAGAKGYVIKDIERFTLKQSIRAVHRGEGAVSPAIAAKVLGRLHDSAEPAAASPRPLTGTQLQVLRLIADGYSNREIGTALHLSENTIKSHVQDIFAKLGVDNRVQAALRANREGWL
jgi:DNA-binding NarL/FixJ family response regulator